MCHNHHPVPYNKLAPFHRRSIAAAYKDVLEPAIKCVKQFDNSWWVMAPEGTPSIRIRRAIALRKNSPAVYFTEFPFSALGAS